MIVNHRLHPRTRIDGIFSLCWQGAGGGAQSIQAQGKDVCASGVCVRCAVPVPPGTEVFIEGPGHSPSGYSTVQHCTPTEGGYFVGLQFSEATKASVRLPSLEVVDYYEFLQINPKAGQEAIHRIYRFLAGRFHPDNPDTGDVEKFLLLNGAYEVLADPERRAKYDASREARQVAPDPIFGKSTFVNGIEGEINRRIAILAILYNKRRTNPSEPGISVWDLERKMTIPREYLDFAIWYLKAKGYITMGDNSDLTLTASGVDYVEANSEQNVTLEKLLHSGSRSVTDPANKHDHHQRPPAEAPQLGPKTSTAETDQVATSAAEHPGTSTLNSSV